MYNAARETIRQLWRGRSRAGAVAGIMALSIGSCVTVFSMITAVLLADWSYANVDRLAVIWHARANSPGVVGMSAADVDSYRASLQTFDAISAVTTRGYNAGDSNPFRVICARMTADMFPMLGVAAARGRWFTADEDARREAVVVISDRMWRRQLGADAAFPGRDLLLDARPHQVVGIMPATFAFPPEGVQGLSAAECWVPASYATAELTTPAFNFVLFGRLKGGVTWEQAAADANAGAQRIWRAYPAAVQSQITLEARVVPLIEQVVAGSRTPLYLFAGAALLLLLIGCANVTNLLLTALDTRRHELAVRSSLGASRATLVVQLLMESTALAITGGIGGAALAAGALALLTAANPAAFPRLADASVDVTALLFAIACSTISGIAGGVAPAMQLTASASPTLRDRAASRGFSRQWWRRGLIACEVALAVLVLVFAGVLARSVINLQAVDPGFSPDRLRVFSVSMPAAQFAKADRSRTFAEEVVRALRETPGISHAAAGSALPAGPAAATVVAAGVAGTSRYQPALLTVVTPEYGRAAGLRLRAGRFVEPGDGASTLRIVILTETLARSMWPDGDAVGRTILAVGDQSPMTIVGVIADLRQSGPLRPAAPAVYVPATQAAQPVTTWHFLARTDLPPDRFATRAREAISRLDATLPAFAVRTGDELIAAPMATHRFNLLVLAIFSMVAIGLALAGVYGVLSHFIEQSRRGFGIRQALGATRSRIVVTILGWMLVPVVGGVVAGVAVASGAVVLIASMLFEVAPGDPATMLGVAALVVIAAAMTVLPATLRASSVDIAALIRHE